jgi:hypothetical protein
MITSQPRLWSSRNTGGASAIHDWMEAEIPSATPGTTSRISSAARAMLIQPVFTARPSGGTFGGRLAGACAVAEARSR